MLREVRGVLEELDGWIKRRHSVNHHKAEKFSDTGIIQDIVLQDRSPAIKKTHFPEGKFTNVLS